jgi:hypothetical protein
MVIKYKTIQKGQPGVVGGGTKRYYASIVIDGEVTVDHLVKEIEKPCNNFTLEVTQHHAWFCSTSRVMLPKITRGFPQHHAWFLTPLVGVMFRERVTCKK